MRLFLQLDNGALPRRVRSSRLQHSWAERNWKSWIAFHEPLPGNENRPSFSTITGPGLDGTGHVATVRFWHEKRELKA